MTSVLLRQLRLGRIVHAQWDTGLCNRREELPVLVVSPQLAELAASKTSGHSVTTGAMGQFHTVEASSLGPNGIANTAGWCHLPKKPTSPAGFPEAKTRHP